MVSRRSLALRFSYYDAFITFKVHFFFYNLIAHILSLFFLPEFGLCLLELNVIRTNSMV